MCGYVLQKMTNRWKPWALKTDGGPKKLTRGPLEMMFDRDMLARHQLEKILFRKTVFRSLRQRIRVTYQHWIHGSIDWFDLWYGLTHTIRHFSSYIAKVLCVKCNLKNLEWLPVQFESIYPSAISVYSKNDTFPLCTIFLNFWFVSENLEIFDAF